MKQLLSLILVFCLLLSGCSITGDWVKEPVTFYYINENYRSNMQQVIASEIREASGHREDLSYLLALYSMGPATEGLMSPLPTNTSIIPTEHADGKIQLTLSSHASTLSDADFTLAGTCIALTCMELIEIDLVSVVCGDRDITIREDNLLLENILVQKTQEETK